jgi:transcriptional regulator of aromatic amino acid metabolism
MSAFITSERLLSSVLEGLTDPAILVEPDRRILASNRAFRTRFNAGADPRGSFCFEMTHGRCTRCTDDEVTRCPLDSRGVENPLHQHVHCMGEAYEEVFAHPVEGRLGSISAYLLVTHPLTCSVQLVGRSRRFVRMMAMVDHASTEDSPVLLRGETGSGKTCVARTLHGLSSRASGPFVVASCSGTSERVLAEELFGKEPRAARGQRRSLIASASGGTLMLQGVEDLPVALVPEILDVIDRGIFRRVGSKEEQTADVRWVLSCSGPEEFKAARTLPNLMRIAVPALRSRLGDVRILAERMIEKYGEGSVRQISEEAITLLRRHPFPGNVRELEGLIERACLLADGDVLRPEHFPDLDSLPH